MSRMITFADGRTVEVDCLSCALTSGLIPTTGEVIYESDAFHVHQDVAYPIRGLVIIAAKRHFYAMDELTKAEQQEFMALIHKIRQEQRSRLGIDYVYYFYNEDTPHHFHLWMVPRYEWMGAFGRSVESVRPVLMHARTQMNDEQNMQEVLEGIQILRESMQGFDGREE